MGASPIGQKLAFLGDVDWPMLHVIAHVASYAAISASSAFYTWVWHSPSEFMNLVKGSDPCKRMATYAHVLKVIQFLLLAYCTPWDVVAERVTQPALLLPALAFFAFGQHLNFRVYSLLGVDGVYYGARFNKAIPWVTEWPYSSAYMRDPQYVGCSCTLVSALLLGGPVLPCCWWLANYCYLSFLESRVPVVAKRARD